MVPVFNPGPDIEPLIDSLCAQTMAQSDREFIFVDDGFDRRDRRPPRRARRRARRRPVSCTSRTPAGRADHATSVSTSPGRVRLFADNDDWLAHDALERLYAPP